jgi:hypothetical protein
MIETKITCDGCHELIEGRPGYPSNDYVSVSLKPIPMGEDVGYRYLIATKPFLTREYHFHSAYCLGKWNKIEELTRE